MLGTQVGWWEMMMNKKMYKDKRSLWHTTIKNITFSWWDCYQEND